MRFLSSIVFLFSLGLSSTAWAHAEEPNSQNIFATPDGWVLRANVGVVRSVDQEHLICEEAFLGGDGWILGVLGDTEWLTFGETAVMRTVDGCQFDPVAELERRPSDATVDVDSGSAAYVLNGVDSAGLYVSTDRGQSFRLLQTFDPATEQTTGVRFLDADTLLVSGYSRADSGAGLMWSVDVATGAPTALSVPSGVTYPYIIGARAGYILLLGRRGDQVVFWGPVDNPGESELVASTWPSWARLSEDGQVAWISGIDGGRGLTRGTRDAGGASWEELAPDNTAGCVEPVGEDLLFCSLNRFDEFDVMKVGPSGDVEGVLDFRNFVGVRDDCPDGSSVAAVCPLVWKELAKYFGVDVAGGDAGTQVDADVGAQDDVGDDAGAQPPANDPDAGCCATTNSPAAGGELLLLFGVLLALGRRRALTQKLRRCY